MAGLVDPVPRPALVLLLSGAFCGIGSLLVTCASAVSSEVCDVELASSSTLDELTAKVLPHLEADGRPIEFVLPSGARLSHDQPLGEALRLIGRPQAAVRRKAVLLGDSQTELSWVGGSEEAGWTPGFSSALAAHFGRKVDVINRGYSGFNSRQAKAILPDIFPLQPGEEKLLFVTIFFGSNDMAGAGAVKNEQQHVPLQEYEQNLKQIVWHVKTVGCDHIILIGPPPVTEAKWPDRSTHAAQEYTAAAQRVAQEENVLFIDTIQLFSRPETGGWDAMTYDGLHLNFAANGLLFQSIVDLLPVKVSDLPLDFPLWAEMPNVATQDEAHKALRGKQLLMPTRWHLSEPGLAPR